MEFAAAFGRRGREHARAAVDEAERARQGRIRWQRTQVAAENVDLARRRAAAPQRREQFVMKG